MLQEFLDKYKQAAIDASAVNGINYLAILTQAAHESAFGKYAFGNNFFGIKPGKSWNGKIQLLRTTEYSINPNLKFPEILSKVQKEIRGKLVWEYKIKDYFRAYNTPEEGFLDHGQFILANARYSAAILVKDNPEKFLLEVAKAGYATDPGYSVKLLDLLKKIKTQIQPNE